MVMRYVEMSPDSENHKKNSTIFILIIPIIRSNHVIIQAISLRKSPQ